MAAISAERICCHLASLMLICTEFNWILQKLE